ncbi:hypothetical protein KFK09_006948 [Dendrobium nobile]|uniref:DUF4283 domain-containing protein n=1 Tax=Dendrobium nobile TaxID=94219 RepID=A0A8T3BSZ5_DENNO|nr:hypothetical protein KFK09_006948 [Dendrobium nobile]
MKIIKWSPLLDLSEQSSIVHVWVSFPGLRPHLFSPKFLFGLGSIFGHPIQTDNATAVGSHPSVARTLIETDISKSHLDWVWLGPEKFGYVKKVVFEGFLNFCQYCKVVGHKKTECPKLYPHLPPMIYALPPVVADYMGFGEVSPSSLKGVSEGHLPVIVPSNEAVASPFVLDEPIVLVNDIVPVNDDGAGSSPLCSPVDNTCSVGKLCNVVNGSIEPVVVSDLSDVNVVNNTEYVPVENLNGISVCSKNFVNVLVHMVETINMVNHLNDMRDQVDWLQSSSDGEFDSEHSDCGFILLNFCGGSDPGNDFSLVRVRPGRSIVSRGRGGGRGRRRR